MIVKYLSLLSYTNDGRWNLTFFNFLFYRYAFVHPDAVNCPNPDGTTYNRVELLQLIGYYVDIIGQPLTNVSWHKKIFSPFVPVPFLDIDIVFYIQMYAIYIKSSPKT